MANDVQILQIVFIAGLGLSALVNIWHYFVVKNRNTEQTGQVLRTTEATGENTRSCFRVCDEYVKVGSLVVPIASFLVVGTCLLSGVNGVILYSTTRNQLQCQIGSTVGVILAVLHKTGMYMYLFIRGQLTAHAVPKCYLQSVFVFGCVMEPTLAVLGVLLNRTYHAGTERCVLHGPLFLAFASLFLITDLVIGISLLTMFFRPIWEWLVEFQTTDEPHESDTITKNIQTLAFWAVLAVLSTLVAIPVSIVENQYAAATTMVDQLINSVSVIMQYRVLRDPETANMIMNMSQTTKTNVYNAEPNPAEVGLQDVNAPDGQAGIGQTN